VKPVKKYTITFDLDGGTWSQTSLTFEVDEGGEFDIPNDYPEKEGCEFAGWIRFAGDEYPSWPEESFADITEDLTLTARWEENPPE